MGVRTFAAGAALPVEVGGDDFSRAAGMVAGDFDQDTDNDLVVSAYQPSSSGYSNGLLRRVLNHPTGTFTHVTPTQFAEHDTVSDVVTGQFDTDGDLDLAFQYVDVETVSPYTAHPTIGVLRGAAGFSFTPASSIAVDYLGALEAANLDEDGDVDLINDGSVNVHWGAANATFLAAQQVDDGFPYDFWTGDFDNDDVTDLAVGSGDLRVLRNLGSRTFGVGGTLSLPDACQVIGASGDFGGDARDDIVIGTCDQVYLLSTGDPPADPPPGGGGGTTTTTTDPGPGPGPGPAPPAGPPMVVPPGGLPGAVIPVRATQIATLPGRRRCGSRRNFRIRLRRPPEGVAVVEARVLVNGKRVKVVRGARLTAPVDLRGFPRGRAVVTIRIKLADGRILRGRRVYRPCATKKRGSRRFPRSRG